MDDEVKSLLREIRDELRQLKLVQLLTLPKDEKEDLEKILCLDEDSWVKGLSVKKEARLLNKIMTNTFPHQDYLTLRQYLLDFKITDPTEFDVADMEEADT